MGNTKPTAVYQDVTPQMAHVWLTHNTNNYRKLSSANIKNLKDELIGGVWMATTQGVGFDVNGVLVDGQNRLTAILQTGITAEDMLVCYNLPEDAKFKIDVGRKRTLADHTQLPSKVIATVRVPFRAMGHTGNYINNLTFMRKYLEGSLGKLAIELHGICPDVRGVVGHGIRSGLIMSILSGKITRKQGLRMFESLAKLRKNNKNVYLEKSLVKRRKIEATLPNLLSSLIEKMDQDIIPLYDDKTGKFVDATDVREKASKLMFLAMQAFDPALNSSEEFVSPSRTEVERVLDI